LALYKIYSTFVTHKGIILRIMKKYLFLSFLLVFSGVLSLATPLGLTKVGYPRGKTYLYRLYLKDKCHSFYSLSHPEAYLSQRSLERRQRQHLAIDSTDLPVSPDYIAALRGCGIEIVGKSKWNNTVLIRIHSRKDLKALVGLPFIRSEKKVFTSPDSLTLRARSGFQKEFNSWETDTKDEYGATQAQVENLDGVALHHAGFRGRGELIGVIDGGYMNVDKIPAFNTVHIVGIADFVVPKSKNLFNEIEHGTMVLSAMAVDIPHYYIGTAPDASYLLLRSEDAQTESQAEEDYWAEAAEYADSVGVDVINSSLGYHDFDDSTQNYCYADQDGETALISRTASLLAGKGIVLVNSAGNDGMGTWKKISFPADARHILTVGAISSNGINAPFSSVGPTADGRIKPDVMAFGSPTEVVTGHGVILNDMGTSFASPLIAGMVACLWQALPDKTAFQIMDLVRESADRHVHPDNIYGYGIPDFWKAYQLGRGND
jgi:hypothetical protein